MAHEAIASRNLPHGLHFLLDQAKGCHDFLLQYIKTLRLGLFFFSLIKSGLGNGFVLMVLGQKHAKNRLNARHGCAVIPTQDSALYLQE